MPGSGTLGSNLIDELVPTVDDLRSTLYADFGVTQYEVRMIKRIWNGTRRGDRDGIVTVTQNVVMSPAPLFIDNTRWRLMAHGRDDMGDAALMEVSLTYTEAELTGGTLLATEEFLYEISDLRGQGLSPMYFVPLGPPSTDRQKNIGWVVKLKQVKVNPL